jgi:glutaredoxin
MPDSADETLLMFHNNSGPMCLAALRWLEDAQVEYATLTVEEHLTTEPDELDLLYQLEAEYSNSEGVSASFEYLPVIFFQGHAYSGFDDEVEQALEALLQEEEGNTEP